MLERYRELCALSKAFYEDCLAEGIPAEDARYGNVEGSRTNLVMTMNARSLGHFLKLRSCRRAQWEIRELAMKIYKIMVKQMPDVFRKSGPGCVRGHCPEGKRSCGKPMVL